MLAICSCDDSHDIFKDQNIAPTILLRTKNTSYTKDLVDSFRLNDKQYEAIVRIKDDLDENSIHVSYRHNNVNSCNIIVKDSLLRLTDYSAGQYDIDIIVTDSYGMSDKANLKVYIYDNLSPVAKVTFTKLDNNNYRVNATSSYDPDGTIVNYHFDYGIKTIDFHEPIVDIWADHLEDNGGVTLTLTDDKGAKSEPTFFELK